MMSMGSSAPLTDARMPSTATSSGKARKMASSWFITAHSNSCRTSGAASTLRRSSRTSKRRGPRASRLRRAARTCDNPCEACVLEVLCLKTAAGISRRVPSGTAGREFQPVVGVVEDPLADLHSEPLADPCRIGLVQILKGRLDVVALRVPHVFARQRCECGFHDIVKTGLTQRQLGQARCGAGGGRP